jgi:hypothetical protein
VWCIGNTERYGDGPFEQYVHMIEMSANGGLQAELEVVADINRRRLGGEPVHGTTTPVVLHVVKPEVPLPLDPDFYAGRISADTLIDMGHRDAHRYLSGMDAAGVGLDDRATAMTDPPLGVRTHERLSGQLAGLGRVTVELVAEIRDVAAFRADPSRQVPVVGHVDCTDGSRWHATGGGFSVGADSATYELDLPADAPVRSLSLRRHFAGVLRLPHALRTLSVVGPGGAALGAVHAGIDDLARAAVSLEPTGAHDLPDRARAVEEVAKLVLRAAHRSHV